METSPASKVNAAIWILNVHKDDAGYGIASPPKLRSGKLMEGSRSPATPHNEHLFQTNTHMTMRTFAHPLCARILSVLLAARPGILHISLLIVIGLSLIQTAGAQETIRLWPEKKMPNSRGIIVEEVIVDHRITQVGVPRLLAFFPPAAENKGAAVVICPGGGYERLAYESAGLQLAKWFNTFGVTAFVLIYRLPTSPDLVERQIAPLQDAQRAIRIVRAHSAQWGIRHDRIGVMGTSAGGHLASTVGTHGEDVASIGDSLDRVSFRPDFMILISPVINLGSFAHVGSRSNLLGPEASPALVEKYSNETQVTSTTPPAFLVHAVNDNVVPLQNSLLFQQALVEKGVSASLHVFPYGEHKIALRNNPGSAGLWTLICEAWLGEMGFVTNLHPSQ